MKKAAIDIGSNTVQMLIAEVSNGSLKRDNSYLCTTRLGGNSDGILAAAAIADTVAVLKEYLAIAKRAGVKDIDIVATAAVREAVNRQEFLDIVSNVCCYKVEVIDGVREAELSACGALAGNLAGINDDVMVIDIGGGSTELIYKNDNHIAAVSIKMGAGRAAVNNWNEEEIFARIGDSVCIDNRDWQAVGVGGTITTAAALIKGLKEYSRASIEGSQLHYYDVEMLLDRLMLLNIEQRCSFSPLLSERGEIIVEGLLILISLMKLLSLATIKVGAGGLLEGVIWQSE